MDSAASNNAMEMDTEYDGDHAVSPPSTRATATTISTIVLQSLPIQIVVGLLQTSNTISVKIVEISPKLDFLGANIEETVQLQQEHEIVFKKLQSQRTQIDDFVVKAETLLREKNANPVLLDAMSQSLEIAWQDLLRVFEQRRHVLNINVNFHEKIGVCLGKMSALEVACRDTMLPNEIDVIQEFLNNFKQLRIEMLAAVMVTLKEGNELLSALRETAMCGQLDSRPDSVKVEIKKSLAQVELWLEELHDRRNDLEQAWQNRKIQLEQCLAFAMLIRDINELQQLLRKSKGTFDNQNYQLDSEVNVAAARREVISLKDDATAIRDRALKITRSTEKLSHNCRFDGINGNSKAYTFLNECSEFVEELDNYEELLARIEEFFEKAEKSLAALRRMEEETANKMKEKLVERYTFSRLISEITSLTEEPLRLGHALLDRIGRSNSAAFGVEKTVVEIENRRIYLEEFYTQNNLEYLKTTETLNEFYERSNDISSWLLSVKTTFLCSNNSMGRTLNEGKQFLSHHHQMLSDLEVKGTEINTLLANTSQILQLLEKEERDELDVQVQILRNDWDHLKTIVENRVDLSSNFIKFLQLAEKLSEMYKYMEQILRSTPDETKRSQMEDLLPKINSAYTQLKNDGGDFVQHISMVVDDTLETQTTRKSVEQILTDFSSRQHGITVGWENWTTIIRERREIELTLEQIMSKNELSLISASKLDAQLYPILLKHPADLVATKSFLNDKLHLFLADIEKAQIEITHHIQSTAALQPRDDKTIDKVTQVLRNLNAIVNKLAMIKSEFHALIDGILDFIESLTTIQNSIQFFYNQTALLTLDLKSVDEKLTENQQFERKIHRELQSLSEQRDKLIDRIEKQEPIEIKDQDIKYVNEFLDNLRRSFESQSSEFVKRLRNERDVQMFRVDFKTVFGDIDHFKSQLNATQEQLREALTLSKSTYFSYEQFENNIQVLDQRIDKFVNTSENVCNNNNDAKPFIQNSIGELQRYWNDVKRQANELKQNIEQTNQYFSVNEQIERYYHEHREYLQTIINQIPLAKSTDETAELINKIDRYISDHESHQLELLRDLATLSKMESEVVKPTVLLPLRDVHAVEGKSVQLHCEISGLPEPEVIWYHENKPIKESSDVQLIFRGDRCSLLIQEAFLEDMGEYKVVAINSAGEASSQCNVSVTPLNQTDPAKRDHQMAAVQQSGSVIEGSAPRFEKLLCDILTTEGDTVEFECYVTAVPVPAIKWLLSNNEIIASDRIQSAYNPDDGRAKLIINNVTSDDKGVYTALATNQLGDAKCISRLIVKSTNVTDNLPDKQIDTEEMHHFLSFKEKFSDKSACVDDTVKFECIVVGKPTPKIRWFFNDRPVQGKNFLPSTSGGRQVLTIPAMTMETIGKITCVAENEFQKESCSANLSVTGDITPQPFARSQQFVEEYNTESSNVTIKKQSAISTHSSEVRTYHNSSPLLFVTDTSGQRSENLVDYGSNEITELRKDVRAQSDFSQPTENIVMKSSRKQTAPRFLSPFVGKIIEQGSSTVLEAIIDGFPTPDIQLTKNGQPLFENENLKIARKNNRVVITLQNVSPSDSGRYSCSATNCIGNALSTADIVVKKSIFPPVFGHRLQAKVAKTGERIVMDVEVSGIPDPVVTWHKDDEPLEEANVSSHRLRKDGNSYTLIIEKANKLDAGRYMVKAVNDAGETQSIADFIILEPTPERMVEIVKTVAVENIEGRRNQFNSSVCSNISYGPECNKTIDESMTQHSSSVKFREIEANNNEKVPPFWRPTYESDNEMPHYKPVKPILTPTTGRSSSISIGPSPVQPHEFEKPLKFTSSTSDQLQKTSRDFQVLRPKAVAAKPIAPPKSYSQSTQYYTATSGPPYHNQREEIESTTRSHTEIHEEFGRSQRIVNMSSKEEVIKFDQMHHQSQSTCEKSVDWIPSSAPRSPCAMKPKLRPPPTPTKFTPGDIRESDYDSEIESLKIRSMWTPNPSDQERAYFRHVSAPTPSRCTSRLHTNFDRIQTPMEFDVHPVEMPTKIGIFPASPSPSYTSTPQNTFKTQTLDRFRSKKKLSSHFAGHSSQDDMNIMHYSPPKQSRSRSPSQAYNEETRASQYGTKCIDPESGLIYFKYDFGYEFGIIFPGEGRRYIVGSNKCSTPMSQRFLHNSAGAIDVPVAHEKTIKRNLLKQRIQNDAYDFMRMKKAKRGCNRKSITFDIDSFHKDESERQSPEKELSRIQQFSSPSQPDYATINSSQEREKLPKRAPIFIAPLKDIAVLCGHTARFECIVQCDPHPYVEWYRGKEPIRNGNDKHFIEFRNGVCRLTIPNAVSRDAGVYTCTGTNHLGSVATSAELVVSPEIWGIRK